MDSPDFRTRLHSLITQKLKAWGQRPPSKIEVIGALKTYRNMAEVQSDVDVSDDLFDIEEGLYAAAKSDWLPQATDKLQKLAGKLGNDLPTGKELSPEQARNRRGLKF